MKQKLEIENVLEFHPFPVCAIHPLRSLASPFSGKLIQQCEKLDTDDSTTTNAEPTLSEERERERDKRQRNV